MSLQFQYIRIVRIHCVIKNYDKFGKFPFPYLLYTQGSSIGYHSICISLCTYHIGKL